MKSYPLEWPAGWRRTKAALIRTAQKQVDVMVARAWFLQMIEEVRKDNHGFTIMALNQLEIRVREWRP